MSKSPLFYCNMDYSLFTSMNSDDYIRLFITDTLSYDYDNNTIIQNST